MKQKAKAEICMVELFKFLELEFETAPGNYGWFHLLSLGIIIAITVLLIIFFRNASDKKFRTIIAILWGIMVLGEIYKQLTFTFTVDGDQLNAHYQWYAFPFQLCSTPLYVLPFVAFLKDGKVRRACMAYSSFFAFFGGLAVMIFPGNVFVRQIGIDVQRMMHHGFQFVTGVFISVWNRKILNYKYWLSSIPVYIVLICIACSMNGTAFLLYDKAGVTELSGFNMFYVRHDLECALPLMSDIQKMVNPYLFFFIYLLGFILVSGVMFGLKLLFVVLIPNLISHNKDTERENA